MTVLVVDGHFVVGGVDGEFDGLVGNHLDGILDGAGVDGKLEIAIALHEFEGGAQGDFAVAGGDGQMIVGNVKKEVVEDGHTVFRSNHTTQGLEAVRKQTA